MGAYILQPSFGLRDSIVLRIILLVLIVLGGSSVVASEHTPEEEHSHHLAIFTGGVTEEKKDHDEKTSAFGLEYGYRFTESLSFGIVYEKLGEDTVRERVVALPLSLHPGKGWRLFAGPGYEWHKEKEKYLIRAGAGYEFHFSERWSIAPEAYVDFIENGDRTWVAGLSFGFHF
jgi:hypothetical protein